MSALLWGAGPDPSAEMQLLRRDFPVLSGVAGSLGAADYVLLIDRSLSMRVLWPDVMASVESFVAAVPDGDYISLVSFGDSANYLATPAPMAPETRRAMQRTLESLRGPTDLRTDLGAAIERCLDELARPGGNRMKFVFILTDFEHEPTATSAYQSLSPDAAPWVRLVARRRTELQDKLLDVTALVLPLGGERDRGRDLPLVQAVFPMMRPQEVSRDTLVNWFARRRAEILRDRLRVLVRDEMLPTTIRSVKAQGISVGADLVVRVGLAADAPSPLRLADFRLTELSLTVPRPEDGWVRVEAWREAVGAVDARTGFAQLAVGKLTVLERPFVMRHRPISVRLVSTGTARAEPSGEIEKLVGLADARVPFVVNLDESVVVPTGRVPIWVLLLGLVLIVGGLAIWFWDRRPAYLAGEVSVLGEVSRRFRSGQRVSSLTIGDVAAGPSSLPVPRVSWQIELVARKRGHWGPRAVYVRAVRSTGTVQRRTGSVALGSAFVWLDRNSAVSIGSSRVTWS